MRSSLRTTVLTLAIVSSLSACSWFTSDKGPQPAPLSEIKTTADVRVLWQVKESELADAILRPAVVGSSVYAAGEDGVLVRLDSGREAWRAHIPKQTLSGGVAADATTVVVGSQAGHLMAFDAKTGSAKWDVSVNGKISGVPLISEGIVVVRVGDNRLFAYNLETGKQQWVYQGSEVQLSLHAYSGFALSGDTLLSGFPGGKLVALSLSNGVQRWESVVTQPRGSNELERMADITGAPVIQGQTIYVSAFQGRVVALDKDNGRELWARDISSSQGVDADDSQVYVTDSSDAVHALNAQTGASVWKQDSLSFRGVRRPFVMSNYVVVGDSLGWVHLLDKKDGHFVGRVKLEDSPVRAPFVRYGEGFLTQTRDGTVFALAAR